LSLSVFFLEFIKSNCFSVVIWWSKMNSMCSLFFEFPNWYLLHKPNPIVSLNLNFLMQRSFRGKIFPPKNWLKIWGSLPFFFSRPAKNSTHVIISSHRL
jgi:hypothetical protein